MATNFEAVKTGRSGDAITIRPSGDAYLSPRTYRRLLHECEYIRYHTDPDRELVAFEPLSDDGVIPNGAHSVQDDREVRCKAVIESIGKVLPKSTERFEVSVDDGMPYIDVSDLPDADELGGESA